MYLLETWHANVSDESSYHPTESSVTVYPLETREKTSDRKIVKIESLS